ncbi:MAG: hypothetical protein J7647_13400 [Cyanobacteria bacterium SBLK]|nr:hypothetical protein [Cyanobacteria bacterium SBLK]
MQKKKFEDCDTRSSRDRGVYLTKSAFNQDDTDTTTRRSRFVVVLYVVPCENG